jgi:site-specific recombinase XerD
MQHNSKASVESLRYTFGTHHAARGTSLKTIQEVMGHQDCRTAEIYIKLARQIKHKELEENAL